ncbi:MAG: hypothetical protein LBD24_08660 [Spirochaetaceae bacterium]|nr:hypothetical protein [Spirochaetaceae bacterium]
MHRLETTGGHAEAVGDGAKRSRATTATSEVTGHGVAPLRNNRRPCLKPSETGRAWAV